MENEPSVVSEDFRGKDKLKMSNNTNANKQVQTSASLIVILTVGGELG
jgi:hypothetical protein